MKSYKRIVKEMFVTNKGLLALDFVVVLGLIALQIAIPLWMNSVIDALGMQKGIAVFAGEVLFFIAVYLILCLMSALNTKLYMRIGNKLLWNMRERIYKALWCSNYRENVQKNKDKFKFVLSNQTYTAFGIVVVYSVGGFTNFLTAIAFLALVFVYSIPVGMTLIVSILVTLAVSFFTGKKIMDGFEVSNTMEEKDNSQIYETVDMAEAARTNGLEDYYLTKNKKVHNEFMGLSEKVESISAFCEALEGSLHAIIYIVVAGVLVLTTDVSGGKLVTILFLTNLLLETSQRVQRQLQVILKNIPIFDKVVELMDLPLETGRALDKIETISFKDMSLEIEDRSILKDINLSINKGENILIKGENGSGKSSLLKLVLGLYKPTSGAVFLNGVSVNDYDCKTFYREICYVSQDELLLNESVEEYLRQVTHRDLKDEEINRLRQKVKFTSEIETIEQNGATLSGGEKKKLLMLKWLMKPDCSLVILDEIDAGLDDETKTILKELENELLKDKEKIVMKISHIDTDDRGYDQIVRLS